MGWSLLRADVTCTCPLSFPGRPTHRSAKDVALLVESCQPYRRDCFIQTGIASSCNLYILVRHGTRLRTIDPCFNHVRRTAPAAPHSSLLHAPHGSASS